MVLATLFTVAVAAPPATAPIGLDAAATAALVTAVQRRLGASAEVSIAAVSRVDGPAVPVIDAVLDPTFAPGRPSRVVFRGPDARTAALVPVGAATVVLAVAVDHLHVARPLRRGAMVGAADLAPARHLMARGPLRPYPAAEDIVDGRATRDLAAGACVTAGVVAAQPVVRPGDPVTGVLRIDAVEARAALIAVDSGRIGARIRVMNADSRRTFRARIVSRTLVEIEP